MPRAAWTGLFEVLKLVNDWLKFAEAKNAGIIGIASAALAVLMTYVTGLDRPAFPLPAGVLFAIEVVGLGACICIGLVMFNAWVPRDPSHGETRCPAGNCASIICFGHLAARDYALKASAISTARNSSRS